MKALNFAILKLFTKVEEADASSVMENLKGEYGKFRSFKKPAIIESLMTAEANGLLDETRFELVGDELKVYYKANDYGLKMINSYIKD